MRAPDGEVVVIDDGASLRKSLEDLVRSVGLHVESFASAQEFLRSKHLDRPACLVLDVRLKGISGLDLQKRMAEAASRLPSSSSPDTGTPDDGASDEGRSR